MIVQKTLVQKYYWKQNPDSVFSKTKVDITFLFVLQFSRK